MVTPAQPASLRPKHVRIDARTLRLWALPKLVREVFGIRLPRGFLLSGFFEVPAAEVATLEWLFCEEV
jgi:hypothetical protein